MSDCGLESSVVSEAAAIRQVVSASKQSQPTKTKVSDMSPGA